MTITSIIAFIAFLSAFSVPQPTIDQIQDILLASQATTTPSVVSIPTVPLSVTPQAIQPSIVQTVPSVIITQPKISMPTPATANILSISLLPDNFYENYGVSKDTGILYRVISDIGVASAQDGSYLEGTGPSGNFAQYDNTIHNDFYIESKDLVHDWTFTDVNGNQVSYQY